MSAEQFAIVELMGRQCFGAKIREVEQFGIKMLRCDVLTDPPYQRDVHPQALYAFTLCSEERARLACKFLVSAALMPAERPLPQLAAPDDSDPDDDIPFRSTCDDRLEDPEDEDSADGADFECAQCHRSQVIELYGESPDDCPEGWHAVPPGWCLIGLEAGAAEYLCSLHCTRLYLAYAPKATEEPNGSG
jgi:hypothetical protein